jgi:hypothetical protein
MAASIAARRPLILNKVSTLISFFHSSLRPLASGQPPLAPSQVAPTDNDEQDGDSDETSSLLSVPGDIIDPIEDDARSTTTTRSHWLDVTGLDLLYRIEFWQLWVLMGLLTGVGLMTIK